jgi:pimeloyl-ACP methyl ester carboxylesterase/DNA-binding winged helix-turn-helix (wHTH) protein
MCFLFDDYVIDTARRELRHGSEAIRVEPQVFDLLLYMIRNRDRVVTKDDVLSAVWPGRTVAESTLFSRIAAARHAIGDSGERQHFIRTVARRGFRFVGAVREESTTSATATSDTAPVQMPMPHRAAAVAPQQRVRFCKSPDNIHLAVATTGRGPPLVKAANWLNHIEYDWHSPVWAPLFAQLASARRLIRYDGRGNGLSDWHVGDISFEAFVRDLESVVDAEGLEKFALLGISQGASVAIAYATRHPERVSRLILCAGYAVGWRRRGSREEIARRSALQALVRYGWGQDNPAFRQVFTSLFFPDATAEQIAWFNELQRISASPEGADRILSVFGGIDVSDLLPRVSVPTLVLHGQRDAMVPFEQGLRLARDIPGARLVPLHTRNHLVLEHEPAWRQLVEEIESFLGPDSNDRAVEPLDIRSSDL